MAHPSDELWMPACYGAALGETLPVQNYCEAGGSTDRRVTAEESSDLAQSQLWGTFNATLLEIAINREHIDVIRFLTEGITKPETDGLIRQQMSSLLEEVKKTPSFVRKFGDLDGEALKEMPHEVRAILFSEVQKRSDGLTFLDMPRSPCSRSLFMPNEIATTDPASRGRALGLLIEAKDCLDALTTTVGWWPDCGAALMVPLYTSADLNCLLHACSLTLLGVRDSLEVPGAEQRCVLRDAIYTSLTDCQRLRDAIQDPTRSAATGTNQARIDEVISLARKNRVALDGAHIFILSNVLRRPIICHAPPEVEGQQRHALSVPFRMSGVYLPLLWDPADTSPDPLVLAYTSGHFTGLCPVEPAKGVDAVGIPLYDSERAPLPVPYAALASKATLERDAKQPKILSNADEGWIGWAGAPPLDAGKAAELAEDTSSRDSMELLRQYLTLEPNVHGVCAAMRVPVASRAGNSEMASTNDLLETYAEVLRNSVRRKLLEST